MTQCKKINLRLASEWHPAKNIPLTPEDVTFAPARKYGGSARKAMNGKLLLQ